MKKGYTNIESRGLPGGPNEMFTYVTGMFSTEGYKRNSPDVNNPHNLIPSGRITMKDVDFPVHGIDNLGNEQTMYPGEEYQFPGDYVFETPAFKNGGQHGGLDRWFAEKWVDVKTGKECGRQSGEQRDGYPACRPSKRISKDTPKTASELSSAEKARFKREKTSSERISYNHKKEYGGSVEEDFMYDMLTEMKSGGNVPTNPELWGRAKAAARSKYDVYPSAYANGFAAKWYKSKGGGWRKAEFGMETYDEYQKGGSMDKLQLLMDSYKNDFKPKTLEQKIAEKLQQEKGRTISRDNTAVRNNERPDLTKKEYDKGNYVVKNRGDYSVTKNNKVLIPVEREGQAMQYVPYRTLKPGEQLSSEEIAKIQNYKEALDTQDLGVLRRPLTYLSDPEKMLGDIGIPGMETSEAERLYFAQRDNHPANIGMSTSDKMYDSFKYGLGKTPGAALNVGLAMLGNPGASPGRVIAEALNPFPTPLPTRGAKINVSDDLARIAKQTDNVEDTYSLARQPLNPFEPLPRSTNTTFTAQDLNALIDNNQRIIYGINDNNYVSSSEMLDEAERLAKQTPLQRLLNKPIVPYSKQNIPNELDFKINNAGGKVRVSLADKATGKDQAYIYLNKFDDDWLYPGMIDVNPKLQGNKIQDLLYQKGIEESQKLGYKGIRSGDHLLSPDKTLKAHSRFEKIPLEPVIGKTINSDIPISGLTQHNNPNLFNEFFKHYESLPKHIQGKHSVNDLFNMFTKHVSNNHAEYGLAITGLPTLVGMTDLIGMPMIDSEYEPYILDWIKKNREEEQLKNKEPKFQIGGEQKYSEKVNDLFVTTKKVDTSNGPRYYQAQSPDHNFSRELVDARARTRVADSIPAVNLDPRIIEALKKKQTGGEETSWTDYLNPANWGSTDRDDDGTFKQAFAAARKDGDDDFMWHGTRYSTELKKEGSGLNANAIQKGINNQLLLRQAYKESRFDPKAVSPAGYKGLTQIGEDVINDYKKATGATSVDPFKIQDAVNVQKWAMNNLYNSDFINKPNQSEQVRLAKTLAAYNWGRGNVAEFLNNKKTAGHDIYNSLSWVKELPKETSDYINKILLGSDKSWEQELNKAVSNNSIVKLYKEEGGELNIDAKQISKDDNYLSLQDKVSIYEKFINSEYKNPDDFKIAEKVFQKLNRLYYNEAKKENIHVLDYMKKQLGT